MIERILSTLRPLTDDERAEARERAKTKAVRDFGTKPKREHYQDAIISEYPGTFTIAVSALLLTIAIAAMIVSVFRVYRAGYEHFHASGGAEWQSVLVGLAMFTMAELTVAIAVLAAGVYYRDRDKMRLFFYGIAMTAAAIAVIGNAVIAQPEWALSWDSAWGLLETFSPPLFVIVVALIGEQLVLNMVRRRHANERAYLEALNQFQADTAEPDKLPGYMVAYANALKEAIIASNARRRGDGGSASRALMQEMTPHDWRIPVQREFDADGAFDDLLTANPTKPPTVAGKPLGFTQTFSAQPTSGRPSD